jgi:cytochrome c peroxidase
MMTSKRFICLIATSFLLSACGGGGNSSGTAPEDRALIEKIETSAQANMSALVLPDSDDFTNIPQDPNNPITAEKVALGQLLYHETALAANPNNPNNPGTYSCASCHHAAAGFKAGIPQGIGEGGQGFGENGQGRVFEAGFSADSEDSTMVPDIQPVTSPAVLNAAFQEVMLWNGQFGNVSGGTINAGLAEDVLATPETPKAENARGLAGLEIQAIAGTGVHRLSMTDDSILQTNEEYVALFQAAYPDGSTDVLSDASKAIAAYERTILANQAPFQSYLKGDYSALSVEEVRGATLFFGDAGCSDCHRGPALSSEIGATEDEMFFAIGFSDFDPNDPQIQGTVNDATARGRGGFTGEEADNYKFKVPQLYNLADAPVFGHGASFRSIRDVVVYKNAAVPQKILPVGTLDSRFVPLGLSDEDIDAITAFLTTSLRDPNLSRYTPATLPSGNCQPNNDQITRLDLDC